MTFVCGTAVGSDWCNGEGAVIDIGGVAYVAVDTVFSHGHVPGTQMWVYVESNSEEGLQRGGRSLLGETDSCQDSPTPDLNVGFAGA